MFHFLKKKEKIQKELPNDIIRREYYFEGTVQNVGFRFEIQRRAKPLGITGFAQNNDDGSVTSQLQGKEKDIEKVISSIQKIDHIHLDFISEKDIPTKSDEDDFYILY